MANSQSPNWQNPPSVVLLVVLAISVLTIGLATRTSTPEIPHGAAAQSQLAHAMRQHLDTDATVWAPPIVPVAVSETVSRDHRVLPAAPPILSRFFEESVYNRPPPPSC